MGLWSGAKTVVTKGLSIRIDKWMSLDHIEETFDRTKLILKDLTRPKKAQRNETFEQALDRLALSEEDLEERKKEFSRLTIAFMSIGVLVLVYGAFMAFKGHPWITLITVFLSVYAFSQAFHFHFWLFQLKNRKLGCSVSEWFNSEIRSSDSQGPGSSGES